MSGQSSLIPKLSSAGSLGPEYPTIEKLPAGVSPLLCWYSVGCTVYFCVDAYIQSNLNLDALVSIYNIFSQDSCVICVVVGSCSWDRRRGD